MKPLSQIVIDYKGRYVGIFYFDNDEEAKAFGETCGLFVHYVEHDLPRRDALIADYAKEKTLRNFFQALEYTVYIVQREMAEKEVKGKTLEVMEEKKE